MELRVNDYVRTKGGQIHKITDLKGYYENEKLIEDKQSVYIDGKPSGWNYWQFKEFVVKSSPNIIDLIEVGDYVNGHRVSDIYEDIDGQIRMKFGENGLVLAHKSNYDNYYLFEEDIKSIVTKEQFSSMEYKINE